MDRNRRRSIRYDLSFSRIRERGTFLFFLGIFPKKCIIELCGGGGTADKEASGKKKGGIGDGMTLDPDEVNDPFTITSRRALVRSSKTERPGVSSI